MGIIQSRIECILKNINNTVEKKGALLEAYPYIRFSLSYDVPKRYRHLWQTTLDNYNLKRISVDEAIQISFKHIKTQKISLQGNNRLKTFTPVYYKNENDLKSFIRRHFKEDKSVTYFKFKS